MVPISHSRLGFCLLLQASTKLVQDRICFVAVANSCPCCLSCSSRLQQRPTLQAGSPLEHIHLTILLKVLENTTILLIHIPQVSASEKRLDASRLIVLLSCVQIVMGKELLFLTEVKNRITTYIYSKHITICCTCLSSDQ